MLTQFEGKNVEILHADRSVNPSAQDNIIYYLFQTWREERYGKESGEQMFAKLEMLVGQYNEKPLVKVAMHIYNVIYLMLP